MQHFIPKNIVNLFSGSGQYFLISGAIQINIIWNKTSKNKNFEHLYLMFRFIFWNCMQIYAYLIR